LLLVKIKVKLKIGRIKPCSAQHARSNWRFLWKSSREFRRSVGVRSPEDVKETHQKVKRHPGSVVHIMQKNAFRRTLP